MNKKPVSLENARWGMTDCKGCDGGCHFHERDVKMALRNLWELILSLNIEMGVSQEKLSYALQKAFGKSLFRGKIK